MSSSLTTRLLHPTLTARLLRPQLHAQLPSRLPFSTSTTKASRLRQPGEPTGPNEPPSHITAPPSKSPLKVWPIFFIFFTGGFLFKTIVDQRKGEGYQPKGPVAGHSPSGKGAVKPSHPH